MCNKSYSGWQNYETWCVNLWLTNEQGSDSLMHEWAQECYDDAEKTDFSTRKENATHKLADRIKEFVDDDNDLVRSLDGTMFADLLGAALGEVDWYEIADAFMEDVSPEEDDEELPECEQCGCEYDPDEDEADDQFCSDKCRKEYDDALNAHLGDDKCPNCGSDIRAKELSEGGGVECSKKCGYWFCY